MLFVPMGTASAQGSLEGDRAALVALYNATGGPNWKFDRNWLSDRPISQWYGVGTFRGRVNRLRLEGNLLTGTLPAELARLSKLERVLLADNQLSGKIPPEVGKLDQLWILDLSGNQLTGSIPPELGELDSVSELSLDNNRLTGAIPPELGEMDELDRLDLSHNQLTGAIPPELGRVPFLESLDLSHNQLTGAIPPELGKLYLAYLNLSENQLSGPIPAQLAKLYRLFSLDLSGNRLSGPIPPELGRLSRLRFLTLGDNQLTGPIPLELGSLARTLSFTPPFGNPGLCLPEALASSWAPGFQAKRAGFPICGSDRAVLFTLYHATGGASWKNNRNWAGGKSIGTWHGVYTDSSDRVIALDLRGNGLRGAIPAELAELSRLKWLYIHGNELTGAIPSEIGNLSALERLVLHTNQLSGAIPRELGNLHRLEWIYLQNNRLSGSIPPELARLSRLKTLVLNQNRLTGMIPAELGRLQLSSLYLRGNEGLCLPATLASWHDDIADTDELSDCDGFGASDRAALVALYNATGGAGWSNNTNWLSDRPVSEWHGVTTDDAGRVISLVLVNGGLTGSLPPELGDLASLARLDLGNNQLMGSLPPELGGLAGLARLELGGNPGLCLPPSLTSWHAAIPEKSAISSCVDGAPVFDGRIISDRTYTRGEAITGVTLPAATGGAGTLTYTLTPALPAGLSFDASTRVLSGTPTAGSTARMYTYTARDADGATARLTFTMAVTEPVVAGSDREALVALYEATGGAGWTDDTNWLSGAPLGDWHGVATDADGRVIRLSLSNNGLSGSLPPELGDLSSLGGLYLYGNNDLAGRLPTELQGLANLTSLYTFGTGLCLPETLEAWHEALRNKSAAPACPDGGTPVSGAPVFDGRIISDRTYTRGEAITGVTLPAATGGAGTLTYTLTPALPAGLSFDALTRVLSGTPTAGSTARMYTYTARDADGATARLTFTMAVTEPVVAGSDREALVALYEATGGAGWTDDTNWLSGAPLGDWHGVATDADGRVIRLSLSNNGLSGSLPPELGDLSSLGGLYLYGNNDLAGRLPTELQGLANLTSLYTFGTGLCLPETLEAWHEALRNKSAAPACPDGGTPVSGAPVFDGRIISDRTYTRGEAITGVTLPAATGGAGTLTYTLTPALPAGLSFDASTRVLSGTPTAGSTARMYTYTARDADGATARLTFTMAVTEPVVASSDREALVALYEAMGGAGWENNSGWLSGRPIGEWYGVQTDASGRVTELYLGENGLTGRIPAQLGNLSSLQSLYLNGNRLTGAIPAQLGNLSSLQSLYLNGNRLTGAIPAQLGNLSGLGDLNLANNRLTGPIPQEFGILSSLERLWLYGNRLTGPIPHELGNLPGLRYFTTIETELCLPPALASWHARIWFRDLLPACTGAPAFGDRTIADQAYAIATPIASLTLPAAEGGDGALTYALTPALPRGLDFDASTRVLTGTPATTLAATIYTYTARDRDGDTAQLTFTITVRGATVAGSDRDALVALYNATGGANWKNRGGWLDHGPLSSWHGVGTDSSGRVTRLSLAGNGLTGELPAALGNLSRLNALYLYNNAGLTGPLPAGMVGLTSLGSLYTFGTGLCLPPALATWHAGIGTRSPIGTCAGPSGADRDSLVALYNATGGANWHARTNWLSDKPIGQWHGITTDGSGRVVRIRLISNGLAGRLPPALGALSKLRSLWLDSNGLRGPIPRELGDLRSLETLILDDNELSGTIPSGLGALPNLRYLFLSNNGLTGSIPAALGNLSRLVHLGVQDNRLTGPIPSALGRLRSLETLDLGDNRLTGRVPPQLGMLSSLKILDLGVDVDGNGGITGPLPPELGRLTRLGQFFTYGTGLCLPSALMSWHARIQDRDDMPRCGGVISSDREALIALYNATGGANWTNNNGWLSERPVSEWHGVTADRAGRVTRLSLNGNGLAGSLPPELGDLTGLGALYLYNNAGLTGSLPSEMGQLAGLSTLYTFGTGLCLPPSLADWHNAIGTRSTISACISEEALTATRDAVQVSLNEARAAAGDAGAANEAAHAAAAAAFEFVAAAVQAAEAEGDSAAAATLAADAARMAAEAAGHAASAAAAASDAVVSADAAAQAAADINAEAVASPAGEALLAEINGLAAGAQAHAAVAAAAAAAAAAIATDAAAAADTATATAETAALSQLTATRDAVQVSLNEARAAAGDADAANGAAHAAAAAAFEFVAAAVQAAEADGDSAAAAALAGDAARLAAEAAGHAAGAQAAATAAGVSADAAAQAAAEVDAEAVALPAGEALLAEINDLAAAAQGHAAEAAAAAAAAAAIATDAAAAADTAIAIAAGNATLSVAGGRANEGSDTEITFRVTVHPAASQPVTVDYATRDGTAKAGADYTATSGTLTFAPGETLKLVSVPVLDDAVDEGNEHFLLRLSAPRGAYLRRARREAIGQIINDDPLQSMWLSRFGRTAGSQVADAVSDRLGAGLSPGAHVSLAGQPLDLSQADDAQALSETLTGLARAFGAPGAPADDDPFERHGPSGAWDDPATASAPARSMTGRELLPGSSFHVAGGGEGSGPALAAWGRVAQGRFNGEHAGDTGSTRVDGEVTTGILGADADWGRVLAGVALSLSTGEGKYDSPGVDVGEAGRIESALTTVSPYARVKVTERVSAWGLIGWGTGDMTIRFDDGAMEPVRTDIAVQLGALGARGALMEQDDAGGMDLALKADAFFMRMESDKAPNSAETSADGSRLRLVLEGGRAFALSHTAMLRPSLELALRHDGGDAETGAGVELGGAIAFADMASGLSVEARARLLAAHADSDYREWGASAVARLDPGERGRGLSLSLAPTVGASSSASEHLWGARDARALAPGGGAGSGFEAVRSLTAEAGYGLALFGGRFTGTPNVGFGMSDGGARDYRIGWRLTTAARGHPGFEVSFDATRREAAGDPGPVDHGAMLRGAVRW